MDAGVIAAIIGAISAVAGIVLTAFLSLRSYRQQKAVDNQNYAAQKQIDRQEYANQKETDRKIDLRNRRMKEYERYLTAYRRYISLDDFDPPPAENDTDRIKAVNGYWFAYSSLFQLAGDLVLEAVANFHKLAWMGDTELRGDAYYKEFKNLYATKIIEMRKDAFEETTLRKEVVEERLPFNFSKAAEPAKGKQAE